VVLNFSEEDRKWFMEAMQANTIDVVKRMKEITRVMRTPQDVLQSQGVTPENIEGTAWERLYFWSWFSVFHEKLASPVSEPLMFIADMLISRRVFNTSA
jgi:hypothetical protein